MSELNQVLPATQETIDPSRLTGPLRLLATHAHPDDESSKGAAAMAKYAAEGADVLVATFTGGERGDILNPKLTGDPETLRNMVAIRRVEMANAAAALGVRQQFLGFVDSGLPEGDPLPPLPTGCFATLTPEEAALPLVALLREQRPHVVTTYDENGGYPHPDHIMTHTATMKALELAERADYRPDLGEPWRPLKVYYNGGFSLRRLVALDAAMRDAGMESPYTEWIASRSADDSRLERTITTRVEAADYFDARDEALRAHATQIDPDGFFFAVPRDIERAAWPTDDYELVRSDVATVIPETDLFAGIREMMGR